MPPPPRRTLYPAIEPYAEERLAVSPLHTLHVEQCGAPHGLPALALHGGPGGGISPEMRRFFDPARFRIILFDQRGCGRSTPHAETRENTTWDLVEDIERIRIRLGVTRWLVFGGSWGVTLALAYAAMHPERVAGLLLRGVFLLTQAELDWFYHGGAAQLFPEAHERFLAPIPLEERGDLLGAFHRRLHSEHRGERLRAAHAWARWEGETTVAMGPHGLPARFNNDGFVEAFARLENHYFLHRGFFETDGWLLARAHRYRHIPARIIHGRFDVCTPTASAWRLKRVWPEAQLEIIPDAGHSSLDPGVVDAIIRAGESLAQCARW